MMPAARSTRSAGLAGNVWAVGAGLIAAAFLLLEVVFPAIQGAGARPGLGIIVNGAVEGCLYALTATALILVYRTSRIINFAQVAIGSAAGYFLTQMAVGYELPVAVMLPIAVVVAAFGGVLAELALRRFTRAPRLFVTVATITLAPAATLVMAEIVAALNPLPPSAAVAGRIRFLTVPVPFPDFHFTIDPLTFTFAHVFTAGLTLIAITGVGAFLHGTRSGRAVRAAADNPTAAGLLGINTRRLTMTVWGLAAMLSGLASVMSLLLHGIELSGKDGGVSVLLPALTAAMVAGFESISIAALFAIWLYVMQQGLLWAFPNSSIFTPALLVIILLALLLQRRTLQQRQSTELGLWESVRALRPAPSALRSLPAVRQGRALILVLLAALALLFPFVASAGQIHGGGVVMIYVMISVSLLIVTGWLGQINLGQFALVLIGAVLAAGLSSRLGLSFWLALPLASLAAAGVAVLLGLAALRIQGLWLAPVSLMLAASLPVIVFGESWFNWLLPTGGVDRPGLPFIDLTDERTFYYLLLVCAVGVAYGATRFRRSRLGRVAVALRDNEPAALASGIDPLRSRIVALALSGAIAGVAGAFLAIHEQSVDAAGFGPELSLNIFVMLILGGLGGVTGAVLGAVFGGTLLYITPEFAPLITGVGAFGMLLVLPGGFSQAAFAVRDSVLRLIAVRRGIDVPSLMGTSLAAGDRRWRLAPPDKTRGLATLPLAQRYTRPSLLWGRTRR